MKYIIITLLLVVSPIFSQTMMWEIQDDNSKIYILGTVHIQDSNAYPLAKTIEDAYLKSKSISVIVNIDQEDTDLMMQNMMMAGGQGLREVMDQKTYDRITDELTSIGIPPMVYSNMKPWAAIFTIMQDKMARKGFTSEFKIEKYFVKKATNDMKEIKELETMKFQISMFDKLDDNPMNYLEYSLGSIDSTTIYREKIYDLWKSADTNAIREMLDMGKNLYPDYEKISKQYLNERNTNMTNKIEAYLREENPTFVVINSEHLLGVNGIIQKLINKGYKVNQK